MSECDILEPDMLDSFSTLIALSTAILPTVMQVTAAGVAVTFYNNVHGFIPAKVLNKQGVDNVTEAYSMGQVRTDICTRSIRYRTHQAEPSRHRTPCTFVHI